MKPYVKRGKTDAADAEAICEALTRPAMRFVPIKTPEQRAVLGCERAGSASCWLPCAMRGRGGTPLPAPARAALLGIADGIAALETQVEEVEAAILAWHRSNEASRRLATGPGIGPITATAILASVGDISNFRSARHLAAWLGRVPKQASTGGKPRQLGISKAGDRSLRKRLVLGATTVIRHNRAKAREGWLAGLLERRPAMVAAIAQANKTARTVWALLTRGGVYDPTAGRQPAAA